MLVNNKFEQYELDTGKPLVQFRNVHFTYQNSSEESLTDFNLSIRQGEFIVLTGKSGCGKTTVTRCVNGLIPDFFEGKLKGEVSICGLNIKTSSLREVSQKVGSVFQDPRSQFFTLHVKTELSFPIENYGVQMSKMQERIRKSIHDLHLESLSDSHIFDLSSGEKQKVAVASVYALEPEIYVLDEPSANLDGQGTQQLHEILKTLKEKGYTIIISEHKLCYLKDLADRVILMDGGQIKETLSTRALSQKPAQWFKDMGLRHITPETLHPAEFSKIKKAGKKSPLLQAVDISFEYKKGKNILSNISLEAYSGEIIGVIGKNGVGKSTLARVLMGLESQKSGKIFLDGKRAGTRERIKNSFYVMQDVDYQLFAPSVWEEMLVGFQKSQIIEKKAEKYLRLFQLEKYRESHPASLSGGQKQRLAVALACMRNSRLLFFDEPTSGLDAQNMHNVSSIIKELAVEGRCIFVISHDYEFAVNTFNKLLYFDEHKKLRSLSQDELRAEMFFSNIIK
jgi:energy-coupling factor transport system ATP-binding protein